MSNLEKLESSLSRIDNNENVIYFLTYDTKNNARAAVKNIYDMALTLKENGRTVKILVEDMASYQEFVMNKLSTIPNIGNTHSVFVMGEIKYSTEINLF